MTRPLGLRRRDAHLLCIVAAVLAANVATSACYWFAVRSRIRAAEESTAAVRDLIDETRGDVSAHADAIRVLVGAVARSSGVSADSDAGSVRAPVVVGRGRTRTASGTPVAYVDVRNSDGEVERHYITPREFARMIQGQIASGSSSVNEPEGESAPLVGPSDE